MIQRSIFTLFLISAAVLSAEPAFAHHPTGGMLPATFAHGFLSGLGHPVIGLDHFAAVVAVGCLAAAHRAGMALTLGFVVAMMTGVGLHVQGATVPGAELLVAASVIALGALMLRERQMPLVLALTLFAGAGFVHGYALGESIVGAERTPLFAYLAGLAVIQTAIALAAMNVARLLARRGSGGLRVRLLGAGIAGVGLAIFVQQIMPAA